MTQMRASAYLGLWQMPKRTYEEGVYPHSIYTPGQGANTYECQEVQPPRVPGISWPNNVQRRGVGFAEQNV